MDLDPKNIKRHARGLFFEGGLKFIKLHNFRTSETKYTHIMQGSYLRPSLIAGFYSQNVVIWKNNDYATQKNKTTFGGLMLDLGRQWVFGDAFLLDIYCGVGYALDNIREKDSDLWMDYDYDHNHFALLTAENSGLGIRAGVKIGLLLK